MAERNTQPDTLVTDRATRWFVRLHSGNCSEIERQQFTEWYAESDTHQREYQRVSAMWQEMDALKTQPFPELDLALAPLPSHASFPFRSSLRIVGAVAAMVMVAFVGFWLWNQPVVYQTAKGERKTVALSEGSSIAMNTDTALQVQFLPWKRTVILKHGEALFTVAPETNRPFVVTAGAGTIQVLGTIFNVHKKTDQVVVTVLEGTAQITTETKKGITSQRQLSQGYQLSYIEAGALTQEKKVDVQIVAAWREGKLVLDETPLAEVIQEVRRYRTGEIRIADPRLNDLKLSGVFFCDNLENLLHTIEEILPVAVNKAGEDVLVLTLRRSKRDVPAMQDLAPSFRVKPLL